MILVFGCSDDAAVVVGFPVVELSAPVVVVVAGLSVSGLGELVAGLAKLLFSGLVEVAVPLSTDPVAPVLGVGAAAVASELAGCCLEFVVVSELL